MTTLEKILICSKTHMTLNDTIKVLNSSYGTIRPAWERLKDQVKKEGKIIGKFGIKTERVLNYFEIDIENLIRLAEFEKKG